MPHDWQSSNRYRQARPPGSFLARHPGARLAAGMLFVAIVIGLVTFWEWLPTQTEICTPGEPTAACHSVVPGVVATALLGVPSAGALIWMAIRD